MKIPNRALWLCIAVIWAGAACNADLNIINPNAPDARRALSDPSALEAVAGGTLRTWFTGYEGLNAVGPLVVLVTLDLGNAILVFAGLSFLGLGTVPPTPEWGSMVGEGRELVQQWWVATFPGLAILTVVMAFNFMGDGFRDWLDPHANRR